MSNNNDKFEWDATECAPERYPMEIIHGTFIYKGEKELGLYIPSGGTLNDGWGDPVSSHVVGEKYKPLPDRLKITFPGSSRSRPVPSKVSFRTVMDGKRRLFSINFDDIETMAAFEKLAANGQKVSLEFEPRIPRTQTNVRLYNDKDSIELKKIVSEDW